MKRCPPAYLVRRRDERKESTTVPGLMIAKTMEEDEQFYSPLDEMIVGWVWKNLTVCLLCGLPVFSPPALLQSSEHP